MKLTQEMSLIEVLTEMSDGNPGALSVMRDLTVIKRWDLIYRLDLLGIYGHRIYLLWNDVCCRNLYRMKLLLEANLLDPRYEGSVTLEQINNAINASERNIPDDKFLEKIKRLSNEEQASPEQQHQ